jgi:hypothetical protein
MTYQLLFRKKNGHTIAKIYNVSDKFHTLNVFMLIFRGCIVVVIRLGAELYIQREQTSFGLHFGNVRNYIFIADKNFKQ